MAQYFALKPLTTYLSPTVPPRLTGRITGAQDYFHVIVVSQGCVTHQMPNPVSFPIPGTRGSGCRSDRVFKLYEGVTVEKQTRKLERASAKTNRKTTSNNEWGQVSVTPIQYDQGDDVPSKAFVDFKYLR